MSKPAWANVSVRLGDLKPWAANPKFSTKAQAQRLLKSFERFGQVSTVAVGPGLEVYDGHQRLSALLTIHGANYEIAARQSDRALTDEERRELVVTLHAGAVGSWDWNALAGWEAGQLQDWGLDAETLKGWNADAVNLKEMLQAEDKVEPPQDFCDYDENIETAYCCPKCGYRWSGKPNQDAP